ncbi:MAG: potassium channel family protein [Acidobacteriota bacterium]
MAQQFAVIGLGTFGAAIVRELTRHGHEVMAVDKDLSRVEKVKDDVAFAIRLDAEDRRVLEAHDIHRVDVAIIAIGHDFEAVVLIAVELMQLGVKRVMARVESETQKKILERLGVSDILSPEEEVAVHVAQRLVHPEIVDFFQLSEGSRIVEVRVPERMLGKTLVELKLRERFHCNVIVIKRKHDADEAGNETPYYLEVPMPETQLQEGDALIVLGLAKDVERLAE